MKLIKIIFMLLLLSNLAMAQSNVEVHFNHGQDTIFTGARNTMEVWIHNTDTIVGFTLGFRFETYTGDVNWVMTYGNEAPVNEEGDAIEVFSDVFPNHYGFDTPSLPDTLLLGGVNFFGDGLPPGPGSLRKCYTLLFDIPSGEPTGDFCVDNIYVPPSGSWLFDFGGTPPAEAPDYFGCTNSSGSNPDCPAVCFPVRAPTYLCGDSNDDATVNVSDMVYLLSYIFTFGPPPLSMMGSDVNCSGRINIGDVAYIVDYVFAGGYQPCNSCP
jgi:hypothetical protein